MCRDFCEVGELRGVRYLNNSGMNNLWCCTSAIIKAVSSQAMRMDQWDMNPKDMG